MKWAVLGEVERTHDQKVILTRSCAVWKQAVCLVLVFQLLLLAQGLTHYKWAINIYGINWTSCCLPPAPKHLFSEVAFSRRKVEEVVHNHCFYFAKRMQTVHQVELFSTHTKMPSLPITSYVNLHLSHSCWELTGVLWDSCLPAFGLRERREMSLFLWISSYFSPSSGSPPAFQKPPTLTSDGDHRQ